MQHISKVSSKFSGFTLIEVLLISPIVILVIGGFIAFLVTLTGDSLKLNVKNTAIYDVQSSLDDMESATKLTTGFLTTTGTLTTPQGKNNATTAFTNDKVTGQPDTLILRSPVTDKNPYDSTRSLIYTGAGACNASNGVLLYKTVYFVDSGSLYKRTILESGAACKTPWQRNSCKASEVAGNATVCKASDEKLMDNVTGIDVKYYATNSSTTELATTAAANADTVVIDITYTKTVAGSAITYTGSMKVTSANYGVSNLGASTTSTNITAANSDPASPYKTTFSWAAAGNATGYNIEYRLNGTGSWLTGPQNQQTTSYDVTAAYRKQTTEIRVTAISPTGNYLYGTKTIDQPRWTECSMPNNSWSNYPGTTYNTMGFTKTSSGAVGLKGLVTGGQIGNESNKAVCTLPVGFRPTEHIIVQQPADNGGGLSRGARVDVFPDGRVHVTVSPYGGSGTSQWVSMDGLMFMTSTYNPTWVNGSYYNSWYFNSYNDGYGQIKYFKDTFGRVWAQGIATGGSQSAIMSYLPTGYAPDGGMHYPMYSDSAPNGVNYLSRDYNPSFPGATIDGSVRSRASGSYLGTNALFYASTGGKIGLPLSNGWSNYTYGWTTAQCYKAADDIVVLQGLVTGGSTAQVTLTNTNGCAGGGNTAMSTGRNAILGGVAYSGGAGADTAYRIDLATNNNLFPVGGGASSTWTSLDGLHYIAD